MLAIDPPQTLTSAFRSRTHALHSQAEKSGIVSGLLRGQATRRGYALFMRNLLPAYAEIEKGLEDRKLLPAFRELAQPAVYRATSIENDLIELCGVAWADSLPLLPAGKRYALRIAALAEGDGAALIAHVYVRYLGDLNGGRVLKRMVASSLGLKSAELSFYDFPRIEDLNRFKVSYREALDRSGDSIGDIEPVIEESARAFRLNIALSKAVQQAVDPG
jgi:heme oxygenase